MNTDLVHLLQYMPGIVRTRYSVVQQAIELSDWQATLTMHNPQTVMEAGRWVRVGRGVYKGDVGLVVACGDGTIEALLVPRLQRPMSISSSKRKRSTIPPTPTLFDPSTCKTLYKLDPIKQSDGVYTAGGFTFEYGLIRKRYNLPAVVLNVNDIPTNFFTLFLDSKHPTVLSCPFPRPEEWTFEEGESVVVRSTKKSGTVHAIKRDWLEVELASGEGVVAIPWCNVHKSVALSDFVRITAGPLCGTTGWVDCVNGDTIHILEKCVEGSISDSDANKAMKVTSLAITMIIY